MESSLYTASRENESSFVRSRQILHTPCPNQPKTFVPTPEHYALYTVHMYVTIYCRDAVWTLTVMYRSPFTPGTIGCSVRSTFIQSAFRRCRGAWERQANQASMIRGRICTKYVCTPYGVCTVDGVVHASVSEHIGGMYSVQYGLLPRSDTLLHHGFMHVTEYCTVCTGQFLCVGKYRVVPGVFRAISWVLYSVRCMGEFA